MTPRSRLLPLLATFVALALPFAAAQVGQASARAERSRTFEALVEVFSRYYWDPGYRDWDEWADRYRERALSAGSREAFDLVLSQMVRSLGDEHSVWLGRLSFAEGAELGAGDESRFGFQARLLRGSGLVVERVFPGSAADEAGLRRGDLIVALDGRDLSGSLPTPLVWRLLASASQRQTAEFELLRGGVRLRLELTPMPFPVELARDMPQGEMLAEHLGYIYLPSFNRMDVGERVHELVAQLKEEGMTSLILDLRGNPGGRIGELGLTVGAFVEGNWARATSRGEIVWEGRYAVQDGIGAVWLEDPHGRVLLRRFVREPAHFDGPVAVLVDSSNSSAGELAALVLQEQGVARVVGEPTGGNVEAVQSFDLPDGSIVMVAVANLVSASGVDFSEGVTPDVQAKNDLEELARGYDAPLAQAVRLLRGLPFTPNRYFGGVAAR
ncbi:MAG TPA: S41 family peptidase [Trueperaceae bacterium]